MGTDRHAAGAWVPAACTLPTPEIPLRIAEFDGLFARSLLRVDRPEPTRLRMVLGGGDDVEAAARDLIARENDCCSFFDFSIARDGDRTLLGIRVPDGQVAVLDGLAARAGEWMPG
jgi:hypothetical protein